VARWQQQRNVFLPARVQARFWVEQSVIASLLAL
jgi:hypothetical protein